MILTDGGELLIAEGLFLHFTIWLLARLRPRLVLERVIQPKEWKNCMQGVQKEFVMTSETILPLSTIIVILRR
jgi:hypothetical protein